MTDSTFRVQITEVAGRTWGGARVLMVFVIYNFPVTNRKMVTSTYLGDGYLIY